MNSTNFTTQEIFLNNGETQDHVFYVYVLELQNNKIYVGKTKHFEKRLQYHLNGNTIWTKTYKPLSILNVYKTDLPFLENSIFF
jgi:hypothetical protein